MTCPSDVAAVILDILGQGVMLARAAGWAGNAERAAVEADHVHNLVGIITDYSPERLHYYWEVERAGYVTDSTPDQIAAFRPFWEQLRPHVDHLALVSAAG